MDAKEELSRLIDRYDRESRAYPQGRIDQRKLDSLASLEKQIRKLQDEIKAGTQRR